MLTETQKLVLHDMNVRNDFFAANMLAFSNAWHRPPAFFLPQLKSLRIDVSLIARRLHKNIFLLFDRCKFDLVPSASLSEQIFHSSGRNVGGAKKEGEAERALIG